MSRRITNADPPQMGPTRRHALGAAHDQSMRIAADSRHTGFRLESLRRRAGLDEVSTLAKGLMLGLICNLSHEPA